MEEKKKINKGGRPPKLENEKRSYKIGLRFSLEEKTLIQELANQVGLKPADYMRKVSLNKIVNRKPTPEELILFKNLTGLASNINQLTKEAHKQKMSPIDLLFTLNEINQTLIALDYKNKNR